MRIPNFLTGQKYLNVLGYPVTVASDGTITDGTGVDMALAGTFEEFELERGHNLAEISATNAGMENFVPTKQTFTCTLTEIRVADGTSKLEAIVSATGYMKVVVNTSVDGSTQGQCYAVLMAIDTASLRSDIAKNTISVSGRPCGIAPYAAAAAASPGF